MKKIVVKISSNLLNPENNIDIIKKIAEEISTLLKKDFKVIIVTSGAVMHGIKILKFDKKPDCLPLLQAAASIGQIKLMNRYQSVLEKYNIISAQILVSTDDFKIRKRYLNLRNTLESLLDIGAIPIFNENDSINTEELKFGDNDHLSALITVMMNFDMLIILTDVDGLYNKDPKKTRDAALITNIENLDNKHLKFTNSNVSEYSSGGMRTKIEAALKSTKAGVDVYIGNGFKTSLTKIIDKKEYGTYIKAKKTNAGARKKWLGFSPTEKGQIYIDKGAYKALKNNSSLLSIGIVKVIGNFDRGSLINVVYFNEKIAQGLSNYSSKEIELIKGKKSSELYKFLKSNDYKEVIHKNNLCML
ncbi:MAG: glutamate 5-kinase [Spirochaetes bacterium]|nr:glutamate 5-kinase [Spirochaetota bacterium]